MDSFKPGVASALFDTQLGTFEQAGDVPSPDAGQQDFPQPRSGSTTVDGIEGDLSFDWMLGDVMKDPESLKHIPEDLIEFFSATLSAMGTEDLNVAQHQPSALGSSIADLMPNSELSPPPADVTMEDPSTFLTPSEYVPCPEPQTLEHSKNTLPWGRQHLVEQFADITYGHSDWRICE